MSDYCCRWMRRDFEQECEPPDRYDCADALMDRHSDGSFGIIIHDGGASMLGILVCPWCGTDLHDGAVEAYVDASTIEVRRPGVEFDLAPYLAAVDDESLALAAAEEWSGVTTRKLVERAASDSRVAAELEALQAIEAAGDADGDEWRVDPIAADLWLRRHRAHLADLTR